MKSFCNISQIWCVLLALLFPLLSTAQTAPSAKEKLLLQQIALQSGTGKVRALNDLGTFYLKNNLLKDHHKEKALTFAGRALRLSDSLKFRDGKLQSLILLARLWEYTDSARFNGYIQQGIRLARSCEAPVKEAEAYRVLALHNCNAVATLKQAALYCDTALAVLSTENACSLSYGQNLLLLGWIHGNLNQLVQAEQEMQEALLIARENQVQELQEYYVKLSEICSKMNDYQSALQYCLKSLQLSEKFRDEKAIFSNYTILADCYNKTGNPAKQVYYLEKAKALTSYTADNNQATWTTAMLGDAYNNARDFRKAIRVLKEGLQRGSPQDEVYRLLPLNLMKTYLATHDLRAAKSLYPLVINNIKGMPLYAMIAAKSHILSAQLFLQTREFTEAARHVAVLKKLRQSADTQPYRVTTEQLAFQVDSATGRYADAIEHFRRYKLLDDSLNRQEYNKGVSQLQIQYETKKKDEDLALKAKNIVLLQQQTQLQRKALKSDSLIQKLAFAGGALLALLLAISYSRYQIRKKAHLQLADAHEELEAAQEEVQAQNEALKNLVDEREWLLKEVHHRVKNNLQIVISLLNSELANVKDAVAKDIIQESQLRMHAISLIHQKLYQNEDISGINMKEYVYDLTRHLQDSFGSGVRINVSFDVAPLPLDVSQAVPLGLILNEAMTNIIKYAFKANSDKGNVLISLQDEGSGYLRLTVRDNGTGLPQNFNPEKSRSLGMQLITGLSRQLRGTCTFVSNGGVCLTVNVPLVPKLMR